MSRISMAVAFGAGYVLGTRAGRDRYREIKGRASALWHSDAVQEQSAKAQEIAKEQAVRAKDAAKDRLHSKQREGEDETPAAGGEESERPLGGVDTSRAHP